MLNLIPCPNYIKKNKGSVSFSNYQIIIEKKYEKAVSLFNLEIERKLEINEEEKPYSFEFIFNKELVEDEYILHIDSELTHVEASTERAFFYATRTLAQL